MLLKKMCSRLTSKLPIVAHKNHNIEKHITKTMKGTTTRTTKIHR